VDMLAERPNHLRAEVISDKQHRMYFDDGKTFSMWAKRVNLLRDDPGTTDAQRARRQAVRPIQPRAPGRRSLPLG
jgi:hypothetical protein